MSYILGVDFGQAQDYTAKVFVERDVWPTDRRDELQRQAWDDHYTVRRIERPPLKTPYPEIVDMLALQLRSEKLAGADLVVDATGVGRPVVDMLRERGLNPIPVTITGGGTITQNREDGFWHVPKRVLVSCMAVALQTQRLHILSSLQLRDVLQREMMAFKVKITKAAHDTYEAWRDGEHDDIVLAAALAIWWGERTPEGGWRDTARTGEEQAREARRAALIEKTNRPWWKRGAA